MNNQNTTAYRIVEDFEKTIAEYCGATYGVAVSSCCNAIFLTALYFIQIPYLGDKQIPILPKYTYVGVASALLNAGYKIEFKDKIWRGSYVVDPLYICDSALSFKKGMHKAGQHTCLSFHAKKHIPIGRGGMVLTDNKDLADWLRRARFDGRNPVPLSEDKIEVVGWNMYMTPEQAGRGLMLFDLIKNESLPDIDMEKQGYLDLSKVQVFNE